MEAYVILEVTEDPPSAVLVDTCDTLREVTASLKSFQETGREGSTWYFARVYTDAAYKLEVGD